MKTLFTTYRKDFLDELQHAFQRLNFLGVIELSTCWGLMVTTRWCPPLRWKCTVVYTVGVQTQTC